jgi:hypothetical protein
VARRNISRTIQSYLQALAEQMRHYAVLRLFGGLESSLNGKLCLDAQVPVLESDQPYEYSLTVLVSYRKGDVYQQELLRFESNYDPGAIIALGPARWGQMADTLAYQFIAQLVMWTRSEDKQAVTFSPLAATTGLRPDRQRFYL